jgi:hypothetical protein
MVPSAEATAINNKFSFHKLALLFGAGSFLLLVTLFLPQRAEAASFYFSPSSGSYKIGQSFSVNVGVSTPDQAANAFQGTINFPSDKLQLTSLSKSGSIMSLWVQEPSFSNGAGTAEFAGVVLNPGYTGGSGKILTLTFKVVAIGAAKISFSSASVLANDGQGTNILSGLGTANISLNTTPSGQEAGQASSPVEQAGTPLPPEVISPTHSDTARWYNDNNPKFTWNLPSGIDGVSIAFTQEISSNPGTKSDGLITTKSYTNVEDGIWYFHVRLHNRHGWGGITHFRVRIDTESPLSFDINFVNLDQLDNTQPAIFVNATDSLSGIDHYQVLVGDAELVDVPSANITQGNPFFLSSTDPGKHSLVVRAYDKAKNSKSAITEYTVSSIASPIFTDFPESLKEKDILAVRGKTYPLAAIIVWLQYENEEPVSELVQSVRNGEFTFVAPERVKNGVYKMWTEVTDKHGSRSGLSKRITIPVSRSLFLAWSEKTLSILVIITQFIALLVFIILLLKYTRLKLQKFKERMRKDITEAESTIGSALKKLHNITILQITLLTKAKKKRDLTKEEDVIFKQLQEQTEAVEKVVKDKLDNLEEEVK